MRVALLSMAVSSLFMSAGTRVPAKERSTNHQLVIVSAPFLPKQHVPLKMPEIGSMTRLAPMTFAVWVNGPQTRTTGEEGTWTAVPQGGTAPYTYQWGGDVSGTNVSTSMTWYDEAPHPVSVTVTDTYNETGFLEFYVYVCLDVC